MIEPYWKLPVSICDCDRALSARAGECLKLVSSVTIVAMAIAAPYIKSRAAFQRKKMAAAKGGKYVMLKMTNIRKSI